MRFIEKYLFLVLLRILFKYHQKALKTQSEKPIADMTTCYGILLKEHIGRH